MQFFGKAKKGYKRLSETKKEHGGNHSPDMGGAAVHSQVNQEVASEEQVKLRFKSKLFVAIDDFIGEQEGDMTFSKGDILALIKAREDGWWRVRNEKGEKGMVPSTYLTRHNMQGEESNLDADDDDEEEKSDDGDSDGKEEEEEVEEEEIEEEEIEEEEVEKSDDDYGDSSNVDSDGKEEENKDDPKSLPCEDEVCVALVDFTAEEKRDLSFSEGDVLIVISKREDGWWKVRNKKDEVGLVPCTFLKCSVDEENLKLHKQIRRCFKYLVDNSSLDDVLDGLFSKEIFSLREMEKIRLHQSMKDRNRTFLTMMLNKNLNLELFMKELEDNGEHHIVQHVRETELT